MSTNNIYPKSNVMNQDKTAQINKRGQKWLTLKSKKL